MSQKHGDSLASRFYIGSLVLILEALHIAGVAYRDLKPEPRQKNG